ncbi:MAG TPA: LysR substrate-binding domain-containing protein [Burkholderiaceae bacterium]|nr:LysR substrate-binding domain-containing protein [Burkholderiaceae bacterium]
MSPLSSPPFSDMHLLTILAETRSFAGAAARLGLSRSSVSMRIAALERSVGVPLVRRSTRQVALTEAGRQLVDDVGPAFSQIASSFHAVHDLTGTPRGTLRITAPVALGRQHIGPSLGAFLQRYPEVRLEVELTDRLVNLTHEGFDLAIRHARHVPDDYVVWELARSDSKLVAGEAYLDRHGQPQHPAELAAHECVLYMGSPRSLVFHRRDAPEKPVYVDVRASFTANNSEVLRDVIRAGAGIGLLPDFSLTDATAQGLVHILPEWSVQGYFGSHILAVRPFSPRVPLAVHCLVDHLRSVFQGENPD